MGVQIPSVPWVLVCTWSDSPVPAVFDGSVSKDQAIVATPAGLIASVGANRIWFEGLVAGVRSSIVPHMPVAAMKRRECMTLVAGSIQVATMSPTASTATRGKLASTPAAEIVSAGPNAPPGDAARYLHALLRTVRASPRDRPVSGRAQREARCACVGTGVREVRRGAPRLAGRVHRELDAHVRAIGEIPRGERLAGRVGCDDRAARRAGRGRDREILRREPRRGRRGRRGERDEQSRGEHERSHDPEHVESLTRGEASR